MKFDNYGNGPSGDLINYQSTRTVPFTAGDGISEYIEVGYIAEFPRGADGDCAYCGGDPCAEFPVKPQTRQIHDFYIRNRLKYKEGKSLRLPDTCPCCSGHAT